MASDLSEHLAWGAVHAGRTLGARYQTLPALTAYLRKFMGDDTVTEASVVPHLITLVEKGWVLQIGETFVPLKRRR